jgi:hypothetical protein
MGPADISECVSSHTLRYFLEWIKRPSSDSNARNHQPLDMHNENGVPDQLELVSLRQARLVLVKTRIPSSGIKARPLIVVTAVSVTNPSPPTKRTDLSPASQTATTARSSSENGDTRNDHAQTSLNDTQHLMLNPSDPEAKSDPILNEPDRQVSPAVVDCIQLLQQTDWSKTCLGPRQDWSPSINVVIDVVMASETQDAFWLGEDFVMI